MIGGHSSGRPGAPGPGADPQLPLPGAPLGGRQPTFEKHLRACSGPDAVKYGDPGGFAS